MATKHVVLVLSLLAFATLARAQQPDDVRARTHFEAGRSYFEEGAYDRARDEFERAYALSQRAALLLNLATTNERLGAYDRAVANIREYLQRAPDDPNRTTLERRIENLERLERERGTPAPPVVVTPPTGSQTGSQPAPRGGGMDEGLLFGAIGGYGAAGAGAILMTIFGSLALSEDGALRSGCGASGSCTPDQVAAADTFALVSDIGLGLTIAGAAAGTVLLILALGSGGGGDRSARLAPWLTPTGGGLFAQLGF